MTNGGNPQMREISRSANRTRKLRAVDRREDGSVICAFVHLQISFVCTFERGCV